MKPDINRYIRYCLFLFDNCTINGLGTFQITQAAPKQDYNGNYIQEEKYTISFSAVHDEHSRLTYLLCSKENYSEADAENLINDYVKGIFAEIEAKNEVWFKELGMLIKKDGELRFLSHKFTAKELKQQVTTQTSLLNSDKNLKNTSPVNNSPVEELSEFTVNEKFNVEDIVAKNELQYSNFSDSVAPTIPLTGRNEKQLKTEEGAAAIFIPAVAHNYKSNTNNTVENNVQAAAPQNGVVDKDTFHLSAKSKKNIVYGLSIAGCLMVSYFLYSFLSSNKNIAVKNQLAAIDNKQQENDLKSLVTEGTTDTDNGILFSKNAVYTIPAAPGKNNTTLTNNLPKVKKELDEKKKEAEIKPTTTNEYIAPTVQNEKYVTGKNIAIEKEVSGYTEPVTIQENTVTQLKSVAKIDVPVANEKNIADTKADLSTSAEFPGGNTRLSKFLIQKLIYPESAVDEAKEGVSVVRIYLDKAGKIKNVEILNSLGAEFDLEIKRVVSRMPQWTPAKKNGEPVESSYNFRVNFKSVNKQQPR
jgi:TonB family protein